MIVDNKKNSFFALLTSIVGTFLAYGIFVGQKLYSDIVTYGIYGDTCIETYPMFIRLGEMLRNRTYFGIDTSVFNGAAEQFYKIYVGKNPIIIIFAFIGSYTDYKMAFIALFAFWLFIYLYFGQKLLVNFFEVNRYQAFFAMSSAMFVFFASSDFTAFASVCTLSIVGLYANLYFQSKPTIKNCILTSIVYVLLFTSAAPIYECLCALIILILSIVYVWPQYDEHILKKLYRACAPGLLGGMVSFFNLLLYYRYTMEDSVASGVISMKNAIEYSFKTSDLLGAIFFSYKKTSGFERVDYITIGIVWVIAVILFIKKGIYKKLSKPEKNVIGVIVVLNIIVLLCSMGKTTSFGAWLFSFIPGFGAEHLPIRFAMFSMPLLFISFGICYKYLAAEKNDCLVVAGRIVLILSIFVMFFEKYKVFSAFNINRLELELIVSGIALIIIGKNGWGSKLSILISTFYVCIFGYSFFCDYNAVSASLYAAQEYSIVHNEYAQDHFDSYLNNLPEKKIYRYTYINSDEEIPKFVPSNYEWYGINNRKACNYVGYPLHEYISKDYLWDTVGSSFYNLNWNYLLDTRIDFIITDEVTINKDLELYNKIIDWNIPVVNLWGTLNIYTLNKFIPNYYLSTEKMNIQDYSDDVIIDPLDDGYFYSANLSNSDILESYCDGTSYFSIRFVCENPSTIEFLPFNSKYLNYYLDGEEFLPDIKNGEAYFNLLSGEHEIIVKYQNSFEKINTVIFMIYYMVWGIAFILCLVSYKRKK